MERIITIDGPAGAGKSTISKKLAKKLGFDYLDTGAMYRAVTLLGQRASVDWEDTEALCALARSHRIVNQYGVTTIDGEDVSPLIRSSEITGLIHFVADNPAVRSIMVDLQRQTARGRSLVTEGRDQGSVVFPNAYKKFYLTATPQERARRRVQDLLARGETPNEEEILQQIILRDRRDQTREVGPLCVPENAIVVDSSALTIDETVEELARLSAVE